MALDYIARIKKTPIVVNDTRGFYVNRCVLRYMGEAYNMLTEGVPAAMIENLAKQAGMPLGPLQLNDETAIDLAHKIIHQAIRQFFRISACTCKNYPKDGTINVKKSL